ncbi:hypothetical protein [Duganella callida]|uniref:hypothetical protein n=1 Tax=Duganella callida TaxID=2561932 RepID=UPI001E5820CF|nr:hypothetical protein [Duganella callida]
MDFIDQLRALATRIASSKDVIQTEEATKNAMIMPFIQLLGYNVFDPMEVDDLYKYAEQLKATISYHLPKDASSA